ncbi:outer membrane protein assembly factor BamA [Hirschia litorea]|uniref:Outer membrane protein assembly factor BamA n=1 Tax=Hirschia litorea TaxID=1199156 RepID=A0ABW2II03_9PROT
MRSLFASALALTTSASAYFAIAEMSGSITAQAQATNPEAISRVLVEGNQRIETRTVLSYLLVEPGDSFDTERLDLSLKTLFATQLFADVLFEKRGNDLVVRVSENPIINQVIFEGNRSIRQDKLEEETEAAPREVFTQARVQQDVQKILEAYRKAGRFAASVTPTYKPLAQNRVDLIFEISEGPKTGVKSVNFIGNEVFKDKKLRSEIVTRQSRWWRVFESNDNYDPNRMEYDRELLRQFYTNEGYADFRVTSSVAELTPDQEDFYVTFTIEEGPKFNFGEIEVETTLEKLSTARLKAIVPTRSGNLYEADLIEKAVEAITFAAGSAGYASVDVKPRIERNRENNTVDITFVVDEGPRVYVERLDIIGNTQTLDHVVRRELLLAEGDAFNRILLDQSRNRIRSLGFFKDVTITEEPGTAPDKTIVKVAVQEQPTGELAFSVGYSSADAFLVSISATQRNFRGRGQSLTASIQSTQRQKNYEFRFTEPRFQDRNMAAGFDLFASETDYLNIAGYSNSVIGTGLRFGFPLGNRTQLGLRYNLRSDSLELGQIRNSEGELINRCDDPTQIGSSICDQEGDFITSSLGYSLIRDHRNDPIDPTGGYRITWQQDIAGLGGDVNYFKQEIQASTYKGLLPGITLTSSLSAGLIEGWNGDDIRVNNRFYKGGNSFRGFDTAGVGPREVQYEANVSNQLLETGVEGDFVRPYYFNDSTNSLIFTDTYTVSTTADDGTVTTETFQAPLATQDENGIRAATDGDANTLYQVAATDENGNLILGDIRAKGNALGGKAFAIGSLEMSFPIPFAPEEMGIGAALFSEFGTVGLLDDSDRNRITTSRANLTAEQLEALRFSDQIVIQDDLSLRASVGVSVFWDSPFGPIRFDFSEILASEEYDRTESFRFSTRTQF